MAFRAAGRLAVGESDLLDRLSIAAAEGGPSGGRMADTTTRTGFDREALELVSGRDPDGLIGPLREQAFEQFVTTPMPSPDTEEWRYTDLREFDLSSFSALADEETALNLDEVKPEIL